MSKEQSKEHSDDENESEEVSRVDPIPDDDLVVQILARLDGESYNQALYQDARVSYCPCVLYNFMREFHIRFGQLNSRLFLPVPL